MDGSNCFDDSIVLINLYFNRGTTAMTKTLKLLLISTILVGCQGAYDKNYETKMENKEEVTHEHHHGHDHHHHGKKADLKKAASPDSAISQGVRDTTRNAANTAAQASMKKPR